MEGAVTSHILGNRLFFVVVVVVFGGGGQLLPISELGTRLLGGNTANNGRGGGGGHSYLPEPDCLGGIQLPPSHIIVRNKIVFVGGPLEKH